VSDVGAWFLLASCLFPAENSPFLARSKQEASKKQARNSRISARKKQAGSRKYDHVRSYTYQRLSGIDLENSRTMCE